MLYKKIKFFCFILCMCVFVIACTSNTLNKSKEGSDVNQSVDSEIEEKEMELITVERFMEIYDYTEEDLGNFNLQAMILEHHITEVDTENYDFRITVAYYLDRNMNLGFDIADVIYPNSREITREDDISTMKFMVLDNGYNMGTYIYIWDIENQKSYYADWDITHDYSKAKIKNELTDEEVESMISGLDEIGIHDWTKPFLIENPEEIDYYWDLYIVLENDEVLNFSGVRPEEGSPKGFYEWLQAVTEISTSK